MKKNIVLSMALVSLLAAGCSPARQTTQATSLAETTTTQAQSESSTENLSMENPFIDVSSLEEAAAEAGFSLAAPESMEAYPNKSIQAMRDTLIQVVYQGEEQEITIRKVLGTGEEVVGDYVEYPTVSEVIIDNKAVTIKGEDAVIHLAVWESEGFTYAIYSGGLSLEEITGLVEAVK